MQFIGGNGISSVGSLCVYWLYQPRLWANSNLYECRVWFPTIDGCCRWPRVWVMDTPARKSGEKLFIRRRTSRPKGVTSGKYYTPKAPCWSLPVSRVRSLGRQLAFVSHLSSSGKIFSPGELPATLIYVASSGAVAVSSSMWASRQWCSESRWGLLLQNPYALFTGTIASNVGLNNESIQPGDAIKEALCKNWWRTSTTKSDKRANTTRSKGMDFSSEHSWFWFSRAIVFDRKSYIF